MLRYGIATIFGIGVGIGIEKTKDFYSSLTAIDDQNRTNNQIASTSLANTSKVSIISKFGLPSQVNVKIFDNYILSYNNERRIANWSLEYLKENMIKGNATRSESLYNNDQSDVTFRSTGKDFKESGYSRGHLAAAANYKYKESEHRDTFSYVNIVPQLRSVNEGKWHELEKYVCERVKTSDSIRVCSGPVFKPTEDSKLSNSWRKRMFVRHEVIGENRVAVPTHFFKVLMIESNGYYHFESYVIPNDKIGANNALHTYKIDIAEIERLTGLEIFKEVRSQNKILSTIPPLVENNWRDIERGV